MDALPAVKARIEKKATFEAGLRLLLQLVQQATTATDLCDLLPCVSRSHALLKARYSNPSFWATGLDLFNACRVST